MEKIILFIGDMNGNAQALARRFVEQGYKCEILPFYEDYANSEHFAYYKSEAKIFHYKDIKIYNGHPTLAYHYIYGPLIKFILDFVYARKKKPILVKKNVLKKILLRENLIIIGTGISPVLLENFNRPLDIYYPSSQGVEFIGSPEGHENNKGSILRLGLGKFLKSKMMSALEKVSLVVNSDEGLTHEIMSKLKLKRYHLDIIPLVEPHNNKFEITSNIYNSIELVMFSRLHWVRPEGYDPLNWEKENKNNDLFISTFANFINHNPAQKDTKLTIIEYGKDILETRNLVQKLGIHANVHFHPIVQKEEILPFLNHYDILVGEFYKHNVSIGGTGLEALQLQKPFINSGRPNSQKESRLKTHPPVYFCNSETEIMNFLKMFIINKKDPLKEDRKDFANKLKTNEHIKYWLESILNEPTK